MGGSRPPPNETGTGLAEADLAVVDLAAVTVWLSAVGPDERLHPRQAALTAAATTLAVPLASLTLRHEPAGRPVIVVAGAGTVPVHVSFAATNGFAAAAVTGCGPVGVDIERRELLPALPLAQRWMHADEARWVAALGPAQQHIGFLHLWTQKEAVGKALGVGLAGGGMRRRMPVPTTVDGRVAPPGRLVPVPDLPGVAVCGWLSGSDLAVAVACVVDQAHDGGALAAPVCSVPASLKGPGSGAAAARSAVRSRTSLPVAVRGNAATT